MGLTRSWSNNRPEKVYSRAGKGGAQQVEYFATVIMAIGEGILGDVKILYQDQNCADTSVTSVEWCVLFQRN